MPKLSFKELTLEEKFHFPTALIHSINKISTAKSDREAIRLILQLMESNVLHRICDLINSAYIEKLDTYNGYLPLWAGNVQNTLLAYKTKANLSFGDYSRWLNSFTSEKFEELQYVLTQSETPVLNLKATLKAQSSNADHIVKFVGMIKKLKDDSTLGIYQLPGLHQYLQRQSGSFSKSTTWGTFFRLTVELRNKRSHPEQSEASWYHDHNTLNSIIRDYLEKAVIQAIHHPDIQSLILLDDVEVSSIKPSLLVQRVELHQNPKHQYKVCENNRFKNFIHNQKFIASFHHANRGQPVKLCSRAYRFPTLSSQDDSKKTENELRLADLIKWISLSTYLCVKEGEGDQLGTLSQDHVKLCCQLMGVSKSNESDPDPITTNTLSTFLDNIDLAVSTKDIALYKDSELEALLAQIAEQEYFEKLKSECQKLKNREQRKQAKNKGKDEAKDKDVIVFEQLEALLQRLDDQNEMRSYCIEQESKNSSFPNISSQHLRNQYIIHRLKEAHKIQIDQIIDTLKNERGTSSVDTITQQTFIPQPIVKRHLDQLSSLNQEENRKFQIRLDKDRYVYVDLEKAQKFKNILNSLKRQKLQGQKTQGTNQQNSKDLYQLINLTFDLFPEIGEQAELKALVDFFSDTPKQVSIYLKLSSKPYLIEDSHYEVFLQVFKHLNQRAKVPIVPEQINRLIRGDGQYLFIKDEQQKIILNPLINNTEFLFLLGRLIDEHYGRNFVAQLSKPTSSKTYSKKLKIPRASDRKKIRKGKTRFHIRLTYQEAETYRRADSLPNLYREVLRALNHERWVQEKGQGKVKEDPWTGGELSIWQRNETKLYQNGWPYKTGTIRYLFNIAPYHSNEKLFFSPIKIKLGTHEYPTEYYFEVHGTSQYVTDTLLTFCRQLDDQLQIDFLHYYPLITLQLNGESFKYDLRAKLIDDHIGKWVNLIDYLIDQSLISFEEQENEKELRQEFSALLSELYVYTHDTVTEQITQDHDLDLESDYLSLSRRYFLSEAQTKQNLSPEQIEKTLGHIADLLSDLDCRFSFSYEVDQPAPPSQIIEDELEDED